MLVKKQEAARIYVEYMLLCEITIQVNCPHCKGVKVRKKGKKTTGKRNFLCLNCKKQVQYAYFYKGADPTKKELVKLMTLLVRICNQLV
ncbi:MAG: hypothetical protein QM541_00150 [Flavobacterium sp.]|nr:hypothetical protein [Flavobacterium sp.]